MTKAIGKSKTLFSLLQVGFAWSLFVLGSPRPAIADSVTYTYTGNLFVEFSGTYACPPVCRITGSVTLAERLPADLSGGTVVPLSYDFTDGLTHWTNLNSVAVSRNDRPSWIFYTDSTGAICRTVSCWMFGLIQPSDLSYPERGLLSLDGGADVSWIRSSPGQVSADAEARNYDLSGTWSTVPAPIPEPLTLLLVGSGLTALGALSARRKKAVSSS